MDKRTLTLLESRGVIDHERVTSRPRHRHCKTCRRVVLAALADDGPGVTGLRVTLDPRPLTTLGELQALVAGLTTWHHTGGLIAWRDPITITAINADRAKVHHAHSCRPPAIEYQATKNVDHIPAESDPTTIPF